MVEVKSFFISTSVRSVKISQQAPDLGMPEATGDVICSLPTEEVATIDEEQVLEWPDTGNYMEIVLANTSEG